MPLVRIVISRPYRCSSKFGTCSEQGQLDCAMKQFQLGLLAIPALITLACHRDAMVSESPTPDASPSPSPGPYLGQTTWEGGYLEYWSDLVQADTWLFINVEEQGEDGALTCIIYHLWGYLIIDGVDVPASHGQWLSGTYSFPGQLDLSGTYYGVDLSIHIDLDLEDLYMITHLDLEDGTYTRDILMGQYPYIPFKD